MDRTYIAIDLKSYYASVECVDRKENPLTTNLVVADPSRTEKTICLAVSPSLKAFGIPGRARLFEVVQRVKEVNAERLLKAPGHRFSGKSTDAEELERDPSLELDYQIAPPRMAFYMDCSARIVNLYLKHVSFEDMHVYSIDEVFIDATRYLRGRSGREFAEMLVREVLAETGITATAGIGTNLYLAKVAMDVYAKHLPADRDGVRIAELDELSYRRILWEHRPLTDFWRVGRGIARKLEENGLFTMGDVARCSLGKETDYYNEELLFRLFGVNAELLIDHAWGWEPCTMDLVKAYRPETKSFSRGQVLSEPYDWEKARIVMLEMAEAASLHLVARHLATDQVVITVSYDAASLSDPSVKAKFKGPVGKDYYGRPVPKHAQGTANLGRPTSSTKLITEAVANLYDSITDRRLLVRRLNISTNRVVDEAEAAKPAPLQLDLFTDYESAEKERRETLEKERRLQEAQLAIKQRYGKNAILKGIDFEECATTRERNAQIGGHKA